MLDIDVFVFFCYLVQHLVIILPYGFLLYLIRGGKSTLFISFFIKPCMAY